MADCQAFDAGTKRIAVMIDVFRAFRPEITSGAGHDTEWQIANVQFKELFGFAARTVAEVLAERVNGNGVSGASPEFQLAAE